MDDALFYAMNLFWIISGPSEFLICCGAMSKGGLEVGVAKIQDTFAQRHDNRRAAERVDSLFC